MRHTYIFVWVWVTPVNESPTSTEVHTYLLWSLTMYISTHLLGAQDPRCHWMVAFHRDPAAQKLSSTLLL